MIDLPEGWTTQVLGSIADCRLGEMLDAEKNRGKLRPYLRNTNVQWGEIDLSDIKEMRIEDDERDRYAVLPGDLLVCEGGEPGRCAVWRDDREMYIQKALHRVRPLNGTWVEYLRWFLQYAPSSGPVANLYTGSTIKHLPGRQLARIIVPTPPVDEQRRIANWLDEIDIRRASIADRLAAARAIVDRFRTAPPCSPLHVLVALRPTGAVPTLTRAVRAPLTRWMARSSYSCRVCQPVTT